MKKKIEANLPQNYYNDFYRLSENLFEGLNEKDLVHYILEKQKNIMTGYDYQSLNLYSLRLLFFNNRNYKSAKKIFKKCIYQFRDSSNREDLNYVIGSFSILAGICLDHHKNKRKLKKIANIVNKIIESFGKPGALDEALLYFHIAIHNWDKAHKIAWKLIKLYGKNQANYLTSSKSIIYYYLALNYRGLGDDKKILQALANAKSCCGISPINIAQICEIYREFGYFYFRNKQYKEAAYYFEYIINYEKDKIDVMLAKYFAGVAYYEMKNYDRALQYFIEIEHSYHSLQKSINIDCLNFIRIWGII